MKKTLTLLVILFISYPLISLADGKNLSDIIVLAAGYLNLAIYMILSLAFVTFVWNVYIYFFTEKSKAEAGMYVFYSVLGFFVILSFWGIVALVRNSLQLQDGRPDFNLFGGTQTTKTFTPVNPTNNPGGFIQINGTNNPVAAPKK